MWFAILGFFSNRFFKFVFGTVFYVEPDWIWFLFGTPRTRLHLLLFFFCLVAARAGRTHQDADGRWPRDGGGGDAGGGVAPAAAAAAAADVDVDVLVVAGAAGALPPRPSAVVPALPAVPAVPAVPAAAAAAARPRRNSARPRVLQVCFDFLFGQDRFSWSRGAIYRRGSSTWNGFISFIQIFLWLKPLISNWWDCSKKGRGRGISLFSEYMTLYEVYPFFPSIWPYTRYIPNIPIDFQRKSRSTVPKCHLPTTIINLKWIPFFFKKYLSALVFQLMGLFQKKASSDVTTKIIFFSFFLKKNRPLLGMACTKR